MASIKGIIVEIGGDTSGLQKALSKVNSNTSSLSRELKGVNSLLKLDPKNTELVAQKQQILKENIEQTSEKIEELRKVQEMADRTIAEGGEISQENYRNLQREIINTENKLKELKVEASNWTKAGRSIEEFGNKVTNISNKIDKMGTTLTTSLTLPIAGIATAAVTVGNSFEAQMSRVQAIAGATKEELKLLTEQAVQLGAETSFGATEVAQGMENLASAGFTTKEIMEAMPGMLDLAASSGADLATSSEIAASAIRGFGLEASTATHIADVYAEAAARTNAQTEDMGEAMKYIAPVANTMGISLEETAAAIGIMSDAGIKGSQAGTSLRGALTRLTKPTDKMDAIMRRLGLSFYDNNGKMKSLTEMTAMLQEKTKGLTDEEKQNALTVLFGTESLSGMLSLINRGSDELSSMTKSFKDCDGAASKMADTMLDNTSGAIEEMKGAFESAGIAIQQVLAPEMRDLAKKVQSLVDNFNDLTDEEKENIIKTVALVAAIGPAVKILGTLGKGLGTVTKGVGTFSQAIAVAKNNLISTSASVNKLAGVVKGLTTPMGLATAAITALCAAYAAWYIADTSQKASLGGLREEVKKQKEAWEELAESRQTILSSTMTEIETYQKLSNELKQITDENGNVKQGYEDRAQTILGILNKALGTEYKMTGNIISQYQELQKEIDKTIMAKKGEAVLNAYQDEYGQSLKGQAEATETLIGLREKLAEVSEKMTSGSVKERKEAEIQYSSIAQKIEEQTKSISQYGKTIEDYEKLQTASVTGTAEEIEKAVNNMGISYERAKKKTEESIEQQIISQGNYVRAIKESLAEAEQANDRYQANILQNQLDTEEKQLNSLISTLIKQTSSVEELSQEQINAWKILAEQSYSEYSTALSQVGPTTAQKIQEATGIIAMDSTLKEAAGNQGSQAAILFGNNLKLANETENQISNSASTLEKDTTVQDEAGNLANRAQIAVASNDSTIWGEHMVEGLGKGIKQKSEGGWFTGILSGLAGTIASFIHFSRPDRGPLREYEKWMPDMIQGLSKTLDSSSPKLLNSAHNLSKKLESELNNMNMPQIQNFGKLQGSLSNQIIDSTKTIFTTPNLTIYTQEFDARKIANEVNKIFGSQY